MAEFRKKGGFGGGKNEGFKRGGPSRFGGKPDFKRGGVRDGDRPLYPATCAQCNKSCEVPFRPNGEKPVLCRDCFRAANPTEGGRDSSAGRPAYPKRDFDKPYAGKTPTPNTDGQMASLKRELELINSKLDKIMNIVKESSLI